MYFYANYKLANAYFKREFVKIVKNNIRKSTDWIARYGGEEFLIVLLNTDKCIAFKVAEKIRKAIEKAKIQYNEANISITVSFGTYTLSSEKMTWEQLIDYADKNLYMAKTAGEIKLLV